MDAGRAAKFFEINKFVFETLRDANSDVVSDVFLWVMVALFLFAFGSQIYWLVVKRTRRNSILPSQLSALGVLGTFVGVAIGLATFDVNDLDASIPRLLEGLKIAFSTSIFGLLGSTSLKASERMLTSVMISIGDNPTGPAFQGIPVGGSADEAQLLALRFVDLELQKQGKGIASIRKQLKDLDDRISGLRSPVAQERKADNV